MKGNIISRGKVEGFLKGQDGKVVSVDFVKKDGSLRKLTGRLGVTKDLAGGNNAALADDKPYISMYEMSAEAGEPGQKNGYRCVNLNTILSIRAGGKEYTVH